MNPDPIQRFGELYQLAKDAYPEEPNAAVLATVGADGRPSARVVLLKAFGAEGFAFYTNLESRKGRELRAHPMAALCFYWPRLHQQVRVEGAVQQVTDAEADAYFATRERGSQIGAWASAQSSALSARSDLESRVEELNKRFAGKPIPRPAFWSGFRLVPDRIEFWSSRPNRLHDRVLYQRQGGTWSAGLLYP
jgi:pyridoxamine 5'-phosphate oxidase